MAPINSEYIYLIDLNPEISNGYPRPPFIIGTSPIGSIDPQNSWSSHELDMMGQICEGLFAYNISDPSLSIIANLAAADGTWSIDSLNYTVSLRSNVFFHDGTPFNASAVKWCFDRLEYLGGIGSALAYSLYEYYDFALDQTLPIINRTEIINDLTIKFVLNQQYSPFQALLTFPASFALSPTSTPFSENINATTGDLVGTGPFVFDGIENETFAHLHAYDDYRNGRANIDTMIFHVFQDTYHRNNALLNGTIHFLDSPSISMLDDFEADPNTNVINLGKSSMVAQYLYMNNKQINLTLRQAISYAINYPYIIDQLLGNGYQRLKSPVAPSMSLANESFNVATYNITKARELMQSMGFGEGWDTNFPGSDESLWQSAAFASYNYTYDEWSTFRQPLYTLLQNNLNDIGIDIIRANMSWGEYLDRYYQYNGKHRNMLQLFQLGWGADFNDPSSFINSLFTNRTGASNACQYNGYETAIEAGRNQFDLNDNVQLLMDVALLETNSSIKKSYYDRIQQLLVEEDMPCAYLYTPTLIDAHNIDLSGFIQSPLYINQFYLCVWNRFYSDCDITYPSDIYYDYSTTGHQISWTITDLYYENHSYAIYRDGFELRNQTWTSGAEITIAIDGLSINTYNYTIIVNDGYGSIQDQVDVYVLNYAPTCDSPLGEFSYVQGSEGHEISWTIYDSSVSNPTYTIYRDGDLIRSSTSWSSGVAITINVDGLSDGSYSYSITAIDGLGGNYQDTVTITVTLKPVEAFPLELIMIIGLIIGVIGIVSIISYVIIKKKKKPLKPKKIEVPKKKEKARAKELAKIEEKASAAAKIFEKFIKQVNNLNEEAIAAKEAGELEKAIKLYEKTIDPLNHAKKEANIFNPNLVPMIDDQIENVDLTIHNMEVEIIFNEGNTYISKSNEFIKEQKYNDAIERLRDSLTQFEKAKDVALGYNLAEKVEKIEVKESEVNETIVKYKKQLYSLILPIETEKVELEEKVMPRAEVAEKQIPITKFELEDIKILRGGDWSVEANLSIFKYKVKVTNQSEFVISNIQVIITSIPPGLDLKSSKVYSISDLSQSSYISPTFKFAAAQSCVGNKIESIVSFRDYKGKIRTIIIDPFEITYVCNLLVPKIISKQQYEHKTAFMQEKKFEMECDMNPLELEKALVPILKNSNFYILEKTPEPYNSNYRNIKGYAEGKYDKEDVGLSIAMQKIAEKNTKLIIKTMSDREEKLIDLLKDINSKCTELKSINELILEYSKEIENAISQIENLEEYLITHLGYDWERIRHVWDKYKSGEIARKELIYEGAKIIGKKFLRIFIQKIT
jgi:peptide/nickel transport system substrate-binding protein